MIFIQSNIDDTGNGVSPVVDGWKLRQSDLQRGVPVFENQYTGERIRWIPLESASSVEGQSPDIANMKAHFCFRQYEHMNAIHFMLDSQGNLRVKGIDPVLMLQSGWGADGYIVKNCFLTMMNGKCIPSSTLPRSLSAGRERSGVRIAVSMLYSRRNPTLL